MMGAFFTESPVWDYTSAQGCDTAKYARFFREMLRMGIYLAPSQFEAVFLSAAHGDEQLEPTAKALREAMKTIAIS